MGLFSSKYETYVGTSVMRAIKDELLPNSVKSGSARALLQSGDIADHILEDMVSGIGVKADRMYNYAKRAYTYGVPSGQILASSQGRAEVTAVLGTLEGSPVLLDYVEYGPPNSLHIGWMQIIAQYGYDPATNQLATLTAEKGTPVFLHDMVVVVPKADLPNMATGVLEQWGTPPVSGKSPSRPLGTELLGAVAGHSPVVADGEATEDYVRVEYAFMGKAPGQDDGGEVLLDVVVREFIQIPLTDALADSQAEYFHAKYTINGITKYWLYRVGTGTHPELDNLVDTAPEVTGTFFPFAYFRFNKKSEIEDTDTEAYKTSRKLVDYLGIDYDLLAEKIDENPDIADVQQAMMVMAVPAVTENEMERRYLFTFFDNQYFAQGSRLRTPLEGRVQGLAYENGQLDFFPEQNALVIEDKRFKMVLGNKGIYKRRVVGTIAPVGKHTSGVSSESFQVQVVDADNGQPWMETRETKYHYYRQQVSPTLYDEIIVVGLRMLYYVTDVYASAGDRDKNILLIPLDRSITRKYSLKDRETLYARSLHYVFNSLQVVKVSWYQTSFFQLVIMVVAIVIAFISFQYQLVTAAAAAGTAITLSIVVMVLIEQLVVGLIIGALLKLFVKLVGIDVAFVIAIIAAAYGMFQMLEAGSVAGAPWAQELMQLSTGLTKAIGENLKDLYQDLLGDYQTLDLLKDEATKKLEAANDLLATKNYLNPFVIFGESPDDFFNRTVHSGNIGIHGISAISSYVDIALTLPKINDTLGDSNYV